MGERKIVASFVFESKAYLFVLFHGLPSENKPTSLRFISELNPSLFTICHGNGLSGWTRKTLPVHSDRASVHAFFLCFLRGLDGEYPS